MGTGFLHVLGGAMQGLGQGMATQAQQDWQARREATLAKIKGEYDLAEQDKRGEQAQELRAQQFEDAKALKTWEGGVKVETEERLSPIRQAEKAAQIKAEEERSARLARLESSLNISEAQARINAEATADGKKPPKIHDTLTDGVTGEVTLVLDDMTTRPAVDAQGKRITVRPKPSASSGAGGESVASLRTGGKPAAKPAAEGPAPKPKQPLRARENAGGTPRMATDAQADAFARDPANKGKSFVGPDGKRYNIPK